MKPTGLTPDEFIAELQRRGIAVRVGGVKPIEAATAEPRKRPTPRELVPALFMPPGTWTIPVETVSEANTHAGKRSQMGRIASQRRKVSSALGPHLRALMLFGEHYHGGGALKVRLTRLGGRKLDTGNLWRALKAVEDSVALMLGADDGDPRWQIEVGQDLTGGLIGVRLELEAVPA